MYSHEIPLATVAVGSLQIDVWYAEDRRDDDDGTRRAYGYRIADNDPAHPACERTDLESGVGSDIDVHAALSTLISFMTAAGEGYQHAMANPAADPESTRMFPIWISEAAYMNADELAILTLDSDDVTMDRPTSTPGNQSPAHQRTGSYVPKPPNVPPDYEGSTPSRHLRRSAGRRLAGIRRPSL